MHAHVFQSAAFGTLHPLALLLCRRHGAACHGQPLLHDGRSATLHWVSSLTPPTQPDLRLRAAPRVAEAPMDTDSSADGVQQVGSGSRSGGKLKRAERESLQLLEWPALCRQVACFAQTSMGAELALAGRLPVGRSQSESETLLSETREAARMSLLFSGAFDLRQALDAAETDQVLHPLVLGAVATTLVTAEKLKEALAARGQHTAALQVLAAGIGDAVPELRTAIATCIQAREERVARRPPQMHLGCMGGGLGCCAGMFLNTCNFACCRQRKVAFWTPLVPRYHLCAANAGKIRSSCGALPTSGLEPCLQPVPPSGHRSWCGGTACACHCGLDGRESCPKEVSLLPPVHQAALYMWSLRPWCG